MGASVQTMREWTDGINDNLLHHIGEYYCFETKSASYRKKTGGYTKGFIRWYTQKYENNEFDIPESFEVFRDNDGGFFIVRK